MTGQDHLSRRTISVEERAQASHGTSSDPILRLVERVVAERHSGGGILLDVGCGTGNLGRAIGHRFDRYVGADVVPYDGFPPDAEFHKIDLDSGRIDLSDGSVDVAAAVETIEHVENPRALFRELVRLVRPGGLVIVTTPNQLALLSKLSLVVKNEFPAFAERPGLYPAHLTALLEIDLTRMARESELTGIEIRYTDDGRIPGTHRHWPKFLRGRSFSDNVLVSAYAPSA